MTGARVLRVLLQTQHAGLLAWVLAAAGDCLLPPGLGSWEECWLLGPTQVKYSSRLGSV